MYCGGSTIVPAHTGANIIRPKIAGPNGLWVNSYNGVLFFGQTDFETQNSAIPMELRFYYNSSSNVLNYGYGLGFSLGHEMRYEVDEIGGVTIYQGDGRSDHFVKYGKEFEAPAGVFSTLTVNDEGNYILKEKTGEKYYFNDPKYFKITQQKTASVTRRSTLIRTVCLSASRMQWDIPSRCLTPTGC